MKTHLKITGKFWIYITALLLFVPFASIQADVIKVLAIGNSFSENAVEQNLYQLAEAEGDTLIIGNLCIPGCVINRHWACAQSNEPAYQYRKIVAGKKVNMPKKTMLEGLQDEAWDYISFQQGSHDSGKYATYANLPLLMEYVAKHVTNPNVKYIFHETWAYAQNTKHNAFKDYGSDQMNMYKSIINTVKQVVDEINKDISNPNKISFVIPAGTAIQNGRTSSVGDGFCVPDGFHLNALGRYTVACVWFEKLTGKSVVGNPYKSDLEDMQVKIAQEAAHKAVMNPESITSLSY